MDASYDKKAAGQSIVIVINTINSPEKIAKELSLIAENRAESQQSGLQLARLCQVKKIVLISIKKN